MDVTVRKITVTVTLTEDDLAFLVRGLAEASQARCYEATRFKKLAGGAKDQDSRKRYEDLGVTNTLMAERFGKLAEVYSALYTPPNLTDDVLGKAWERMGIR